MPLIVDLFESIEGSTIAIMTKTCVWTYAEFNEKINRLARYLIDQGLCRGDSAVICLNDPVEQILASWAVMKTGGYFIPLDHRDPVSYRQALIDRACPKICLESMPALNHYSSENLHRKISSHDIAYMIYTSGSTGAPKGVRIEHGSFAHRLQHGARLLDINRHSRVLSQASPAFDMHLAEWGLAQTHGAALCPLDTKSYSFQTEINDHNITHALFTPGVLRQLDPLALTTLKCVLVGGEATPQHVIDEWRSHVKIVNGYGPTEGTIFTHLHPYEERDLSRVIGKALPGISCSILDESGTEVTAGSIGELVISGIGISDSYPTGDLTRLLPNGLYEFICRKEEYVKIRGARVDLFAVEQRIHERFPDLQVTLKAVDRGVQGYVLSCFFVGEASLQKEIRSFLRSQLPLYMVPTLYERIPELPRLTNGKVNRLALSPSFSAEPLLLEGETQKKLFAIWSEILNVTPASLMDDFFAIGGDSLLAVHLMIALEKEWNLSMSMQDLINRSTFGELCDWIDAHRQEEKKLFLVPFHATGRHPPLILVHPAIGLADCYRPLSQYIKDRPLYGIQNLSTPFPTLLGMAEAYLKEIQLEFPQGRYILAGWSLGGVVALEMAELLRKSQGALCPVILIDSFAPVEVQEDPSFPRYDLLKQHQPVPYQGPVYLLHSTTSPSKDNGWNFLPNLCISEIPFKHEDLFDEGNIPMIAKMINQVLTQSETVAFGAPYRELTKHQVEYH